MKQIYNYSFKPMSTVLFAAEGEPPAVTPEVQVLIDAAVAKEVSGLKNKNTELLGGMAQTKQELAAAKEAAKQFEGLDVAKARALLASMDTDEDLKLFQEGKRDQVISKHTERMRAAHTAELAALQEQIKQAQTVGEAYRGRVLDAQILSVATGLHKGAVEDALLVGRQIFTLDAKGNAVKLDAEGKPELGKDGKTPFSPAEWMEAQREAKPHWFPAASSGSGAGGNTGAGGNGRTMKRAQFDVLPPQSQRDYIKAGGKLYD
jgi:hypothetical protein